MSFKDFNGDTKKTVQSNLNQVIDIIQEDIAGSATRRKYQTFVTGGIGPGVTSSLYQTVYDQDFTLQTANPVLDLTVGLFHSDDGVNKRLNLVTQESQTGYSLSSATGQLLFNHQTTMMMREKINVYRQYANYLLGDPNAAFILDPVAYPSSRNKSGFNVVTDTTVIDAALFVNVKRLFKRDGIRKETFAIRLYENAPPWDDTHDPTTEGGGTQYQYNYDEDGTINTGADIANQGTPQANVSSGASEFGVRIIADLGAAQSHKSDSTAGDISLLRLASDQNVVVGLLFYQAGIAVLNLGGSSINGQAFATGVELDTGLGQSAQNITIDTVFEPRDPIFGVIKGMSSGGAGSALAGEILIGNDTVTTTNHPSAGPLADRSASTVPTGTANLGPATFYPDLLVSASIDDIVDHIGFTRFSSGSLTAMAFQNQTKINSSIYFCRASANEFNSSNNPTFLDADNISVTVQDAENDKPFTYITTVALADTAGEVVAIAKLNRPIEKNDESELTIRVRLDF